MRARSVVGLPAIDPLRYFAPTTRSLLRRRRRESMRCATSARARDRYFAAANADRSGALVRRDDHGLHRRGHLVCDLDDDHVGACMADRLLEVDLAPVDLDPARVPARL